MRRAPLFKLLLRLGVFCAWPAACTPPAAWFEAQPWRCSRTCARPDSLRGGGTGGDVRNQNLRPPPLSARPMSWREMVDLSVYETMLKDSPHDADVWSAYGHALMAGHDDPSRAMQAYGRAIELAPSHSYALNNLGYILMQYRGDIAMAEGCYRRAVSADPNDMNANVNLAVLLSAHREPPDFEAAAECYERALAVDQKHIGALVNFANFLVERPLPSLDVSAAAAARVCAQETESEDRVSGRPSLGRKACNDGSFTYEELSRPQTQAEQRAAETAITHMIGKLQDWKRAAILYDRALEVKPDSADAMCGYAALKRHEDDSAAAEALYTAALAADPGHHASRSQYGLMLHRQNDLPRAREQYEQALAINPRDAGTRYDDKQRFRV